MGYREPCTNIYLFKGCPCDKSYNNTIYFTDKSTQWIYFRDNFGNGRTISYRNQSYQRFAKGTLRIMEKADNLYEFNYMAFCNDIGFNPLVGPTGDMKVFYCFIDSVTYINENVTEVKYTIDVIQTYMFNYKLGMCFVEREHTETDYVGDNTIPEDIDIGELTVSDKWDFIFPNVTGSNPNLTQYEVIVYYVPNVKYVTNWNASDNKWDTADWNDTIPRGDIINGVYQGCIPEIVNFEIGNTTSITRAREQLDKLIFTIIDTCKGEIVDMIQVPSSMGSHWAIGEDPWTVNRTQYNSFPNLAHNKFYQAKNKKLLSYPYQRIIVSNNMGTTGEYKWEEFTMSPTQQRESNTMSCSFKIDETPLPSPEVTCYPHNYRGITDDYENSIMLIDFPKPSWNEDSFSKWWASNQNSYALSILNGVISGALAIGGGILMATGAGAPAGAAAAGAGLSASQLAGGIGIASGTAGLFRTATSAMGTYADKKNTPDQLKGQVANNTLRIKQNRVGYTFYNTTLNYEKAEKIDSYFNMFGYAIKQVKIPNLFKPNVTLRPYWNYIKNMTTVVLPIEVNNTEHFVDLDVEEKLQQIYNNGITFWMEGRYVGDYSQDNRPTT